MGRGPRDVSGFVALPITLQSPIESFAIATHYLYLRPHDPNVADEDAPRSLFVVNIPVTTTETHLKHLFASQLAAGRTERIHFSEDAPGRASVAVGKTSRSKKRKRVTAEEAEAGLDAFELPKTSDNELHSSGASAIVVFVDPPSMELTLKAAKKAVKIGQEITWGSGIELKVADQGLRRYQQINQLRYPSQNELLENVDAYMTAYSRMEEARSRENTRKRQVPDEDGFITVTRGSKGGFRKEEAEGLATRRQEKSAGLGNFYRFQMREARREQQNEMLQKFEQDKRMVEEMRRRRQGQIEKT